MDKIAQLNAKLNPNAEIYRILTGAEQLPWWKALLSIEGVYVEIRKDDIVDVYYEGGRMAELKCKGERLTATCHEKYLGYKVPQKTKSMYIDCLDTLKEAPYIIIENIKKHYSQKDCSSGENIGEKKLQGSMICHDRTRFLDSEFAHRHEEGDRSTIRIDLVDIKDNELRFVELKRIQDNRLLNKEDDKPEFLEQMEKYRKFIQTNHEGLLLYYKDLYCIKEKLGLPVPKCNLDELSVCMEPLLIIINTYEKKERVSDQERRKNRIARIKGILKENGISFEII